MDLRLTSFEDIDALMSIIATCMPIALAVLGSAFGIRASRERTDDGGSSGITVVRLIHQFETPAKMKRRRRYQYIELLIGMSLCVWFVNFQLQQGSLFPQAQTAQERIINNLYDGWRWATALFYIALIPVYVRTLSMLWRTPLKTQSPACVAAEIVVAAPRNVVAQRCHLALRRLRTSITKIDLEAGYVEARKHYFFNLYKPYFDELTIRLERVADDEYRLSLRSDGIIPTLRGDKKRNEANVQRLIRYITG